MDFTYNPKYGVFSKDIFFKPGPTFMLRRAALLDIINELKSGKYLEIGFGLGILTYEFFLRGFECHGVEIEKKAVDMASTLFGDCIKFQSSYEETWDANKFDYIGFYEVLEHNEDDYGFLIGLKKYLKTGGKIIFSVPAHQKKFSTIDKLAGHYRRYEKETLIGLLNKAGFKVEKIISVGFPFSNIVLWIENRTIYKLRDKNIGNLDIGEKTKVSGCDRKIDFRFRFLPYKTIAYLFSKFQRNFYSTDLGIQYAVVATKL